MRDYDLTIEQFEYQYGRLTDAWYVDQLFKLTSYQSAARYWKENGKGEVG